jgi:ParB family chromosome partitioning protein
MVERRPALGKGLSALIPDAPEPHSATLEIDTDLIAPSRYQPRTHMDPAAIEDLTRSIRANGIIQPIIVRREGMGYEIIAGERRWRAAQQAGLLRVPVVVRDIPPGQEGKLLEMALTENLQREDLNPIEQALAYRRLGDEFELTQDQIADGLGKDRSSVANTMRLLRLPVAVREHLASGTLSMGHARALLGLEHEAAILAAASQEGAEDRRAHTRGRAGAAPRPRRARPHRPAPSRRADRDRFQVGRRTAAAVRTAHGGVVAPRRYSGRPGATSRGRA